MVTDKAVVISGSSTGIGRACALHLARKGYHVFAGVRNEKDRESLIHEGIARLEPLFFDVSDAASISSAQSLVKDRTGGKLFCLINNAGITEVGPLECIDFSQIPNLFDVNILGMMNCIKHFIPLLRNASGRIINIGSISGILAMPGLSIYAASKFAVEGLSDSLRLELKPQGIAVTVIEPGDTETPIMEKARVRFDSNRQCGDAQDYYQWLFKVITRSMNSSKKQPVECVVRAVEKAVLSKKPKARYRVGRDARLFYLLEKIPQPFRDRILCSVFNV